MWQSSNSSSNSGKFWTILLHSTFDECWNCLAAECEFENAERLLFLKFNLHLLNCKYWLWFTASTVFKLFIVKKYWFVTVWICERSEHEHEQCFIVKLEFTVTIVWSDIDGWCAACIYRVIFLILSNIRIRISTDLYIKIRIRRMQILINSVTSLVTSLVYLCPGVILLVMSLVYLKLLCLSVQVWYY